MIPNKQQVTRLLPRGLRPVLPHMLGEGSDRVISDCQLSSAAKLTKNVISSHECYIKVIHADPVFSKIVNRCFTLVVKA